MGYDDLKVIEAKKFLVAVTGGEQRNSTIDEALADASVITAIAASAVDGQWHKVAAGPGSHLRSRRARRVPAMPEAADLPLVVGLGVVDPDLVNPVLGGHCRFVAGPDRGRPGAGAGRDRPGRRPGGQATSWPGRPRLRVIARTGVGVERVDLDAATARGIAVVITPGAGTDAVAEGAIAMAMHLVKRFGRLTTLVRDRPVGRPAAPSRSATSPAPTLGVVGYGRIGQRAAALGAALGMRVLAYDPVSEPPADVRCADLADLVSRSDVHHPAPAAAGVHPAPGRTGRCSATSNPGRSWSTAAAAG